jgi:hypothetical protein
MELIALRDGSDMSGPVAEGASEFAAKLASFVKDNRLAGTVAAVVHGNEMAWSGAAGFADIAAKRPARPDTLYRIASITKTFTGTAIMRRRYPAGDRPGHHPAPAVARVRPDGRPAGHGVGGHRASL